MTALDNDDAAAFPRVKSANIPTGGMFPKQIPRAAGRECVTGGLQPQGIRRGRVPRDGLRLGRDTPVGGLFRVTALDIDGAAYARPRRNSKIRRHDFTPQTIRRNIALGESPLAAAA